jgi:hypothetical protein
MRWTGYAAHMGKKKRNAYRVLVGNPEGKRPLEIPTHRREDNIIILTWILEIDLDDMG